jgi:hypothetical protein
MQQMVPQYIRTPYSPFNVQWGLTEQVCQINYHDDHIVEVDWDPHRRLPVVQQNGAWFLLHSPDVGEMTMRHVLDALEYSNEILVLTYPNLNIENFLDTPLSETPISQMEIFPVNVQEQEQGQEQEPIQYNGQPLQQPEQIPAPPEEPPPSAEEIQLIASLFGLGRIYR